MINISDFSRAPCAIVAKAENDSQQNVYKYMYCSLIQINLFVYSAV